VEIGYTVKPAHSDIKIALVCAHLTWSCGNRL